MTAGGITSLWPHGNTRRTGSAPPSPGLPQACYCSPPQPCRPQQREHTLPDYGCDSSPELDTFVSLVAGVWNLRNRKPKQLWKAPISWLAQLPPGISHEADPAVSPTSAETPRRAPAASNRSSPPAHPALHPLSSTSEGSQSCRHLHGS